MNGRDVVTRAVELLGTALHADPTVVVRSPGRVNLIGEHTDYNDGVAMPMAIDRGLVLAAAARDDDTIRLVSGLDDVVHQVDASGVEPGGDVPRWVSWTTYVQGVLREVWPAGAASGFDLAIASNLPEGAGLSSSAALELGVARVAAALDGTTFDRGAAARAGRRAENEWVGVSTGLLDQLAVAHGRAGHALVLDCGDATWDEVAVPDGLEVVVLDTGARRSLVGSAYDDRRRACEEAASRLGVANLSAVADVADLAGLPDRLRRRARHVVTENARVHDVATALPTGDLDAVGTALRASHDSLRDDYEVTGPELDTMAEVANGTDGVVGARMTGGGFGGAVVALMHTGAVDLDDVVARYRAVHELPARALVVRPADGTSRIALP